MHYVCTYSVMDALHQPFMNETTDNETDVWDWMNGWTVRMGWDGWTRWTRNAISVT